jgi:hypothetical protein
LGQTASNHGRKLIRPAQRHGRNDHFRRKGATIPVAGEVSSPPNRSSLAFCVARAFARMNPWRRLALMFLSDCIGEERDVGLDENVW